MTARPRVGYALWFFPLMDHLAILSQTTADHARKLAYEEWESEHGNFLEEILRNTPDSLTSASNNNRSSD